MDQLFLSVAFADVPKLNRLASEPGRKGIQLYLPLLHDFLPVSERLESLYMSLLFCRSRSRSAHDPRKILAIQGGRLSLRRNGKVHSFLFQLQITGISRLIAVSLSPVHLKDLICNLIQKIAVMGNHQNCPAKILQIILQPLDHLMVEMVRGLIQNQKVTRRQDRGDKRRPFLLSPGQDLRTAVGIRNPKIDKPRAHLSLCVPVICLPADRLRHILQKCSAVIENRVLRKIRNPDGISLDHLS